MTAHAARARVQGDAVYGLSGVVRGEQRVCGATRGLPARKQTLQPSTSNATTRELPFLLVAVDALSCRRRRYYYFYY